MEIPLQVARALRLLDKLGSVSEVAHSLGVSQPAISKSIAQFEARLGTPLVVRGARHRSGAG